ncbi:MAG: DNA-3-methyladenine glycosylase I [Caulobacterales bacterium]|uniref:DNA-3-methyladenine glycosylase I n=1 Tax=Glycocaulis sp. TaxID=1969725 RepID=UPI003F9EBC4F
MIHRCAWPGEDPLYIDYHDTEWGVPERDSEALFAKLILDGFQAGLSWITILRKREAFLEAFDGFNPETLARYDETDIARLLANPGIIRSRAKIEAAIGNAKAYLAMRERGVAFSPFLWDFVDDEPVQNRFSERHAVPAETPASQAMSKALKKEGFKFCGPVIVYAFMQATGMVNDHLVTCFRHEECAALSRPS